MQRSRHSHREFEWVNVELIVVKLRKLLNNSYDPEKTQNSKKRRKMFLIILFPDIWHIKQDLLKSTTICETRMHHSSTYAKKRYWHSTKYNTISLMGIAAGFNNMPVDTNILVEKTNSSYSVGDVLILYVGTNLHTLVAKKLPYDTNVSCSDRTRFTTKPLDKNIEWHLPVVCLLVEVYIPPSYIAVVY